jgi:hypothetical protein
MLCESLNFENCQLQCVGILNDPAGIILALRQLSYLKMIPVEQAGREPFGISEPA